MSFTYGSVFGVGKASSEACAGGEGTGAAVSCVGTAASSVDAGTISIVGCVTGSAGVVSSAGSEDAGASDAAGIEGDGPVTSSAAAVVSTAADADAFEVSINVGWAPPTAGLAPPAEAEAGEAAGAAAFDGTAASAPRTSPRRWAPDLWRECPKSAPVSSAPSVAQSRPTSARPADETADPPCLFAARRDPEPPWRPIVALVPKEEDWLPRAGVGGVPAAGQPREGAERGRVCEVLRAPGRAEIAGRRSSIVIYCAAEHASEIRWELDVELFRRPNPRPRSGPP